MKKRRTQSLRDSKNESYNFILEALIDDAIVHLRKLNTCRQL